jgi:hypothetical protein
MRAAVDCQPTSKRRVDVEPFLPSVISSRTRRRSLQVQGSDLRSSEVPSCENIRVGMTFTSYHLVPESIIASSVTLYKLSREPLVFVVQ